MIDLALQHLATELNRFLKSGSSGAEDMVALTGLMEADGSANPAAQNRLVMFLCGLEQASGLQQGPGPAPVLDAYMLDLYSLDLYIMVAANFSAAQHAQALRSLSAAIGFFHRQPLFDRHSTPNLAPGIERLVVDLHNLKPPEAAAIWGAIGARYLPSVMYRVRMVAGDGAAGAGRPALQRLSSGAAYMQAPGAPAFSGNMVTTAPLVADVVSKRTQRSPRAPTAMFRFTS